MKKINSAKSLYCPFKRTAECAAHRYSYSDKDPQTGEDKTEPEATIQENIESDNLQSPAECRHRCPASEEKEVLLEYSELIVCLTQGKWLPHRIAWKAPPKWPPDMRSERSFGYCKMAADGAKNSM